MATRGGSENKRTGGLAAKYWVRLTAEERRALEEITKKKSSPARAIQHAWILLKADASSEGPDWIDEDIARVFRVSLSTITRVRRAFVEEGLDAALYRKRSERTHLRKVDGDLEAQVIALLCSPPPEGEGRWTLRLLAEKVVELEYVDTISHETVRQILKKTNLSRG